MSVKITGLDKMQKQLKEGKRLARTVLIFTERSD